jgi:hypothetical protein
MYGNRQTFAIADARFGLGAELFAPNNRFMMVVEFDQCGV